jgi:hydrogenase maturation protease
MRVLIAGFGNLFFGDDGYGVAAAQRLALEPLPAGVRVIDAGIRSVDLAFELYDGYDVALVLDALPRGGAPGTLYALEPTAGSAAPVPDPHALRLESVFAFCTRLAFLGTVLPRTLVIGCEPADVGWGRPLSPPVARAVEETVPFVRRVLAQQLGIPAWPGMEVSS